MADVHIDRGTYVREKNEREKIFKKTKKLKKKKREKKSSK